MVEGGGGMYELSYEDQFRSAFEIADSNGDGILSYSEALEVRVLAYMLAKL